MAATEAHAPPGYGSWPHPKRRVEEPVDPRLVHVIQRALLGALLPGAIRPTAEHVAERVWDWLAEGDR